MKRIILFSLSFLILFVEAGFSQTLVNTGKLIQGGVDDGVKMVNAYILPLNRSIMSGMNSSDFTTLYNGDKKRFSVSFNTSLVNIPTEDQTFDVNTLGLEHITAEPGNSIAQTVFGDSTTITLYSKDSIPDQSGLPINGGGGFPLKNTEKIDSVASFSFQSISGSDIHMFLLPHLNVSYKFDFGNLSVGILPYFSSKTTLFLWGITWQQNLSMFIPKLKESAFKISGNISYYSFYLRNKLEVQPDGVTVPYSLSGEPTGPYDNQELKMNYSSIYFGANLAYTIKKFTLWGNIGYNLGTSRVRILGTYPIYGSDPTGNASVAVKDIDDPMDESDIYNILKGSLGVRFDFSRYYIQANYTIASYGGVGFALGVRF